MGGAVQIPPKFLLLFFVPSAPQKSLPGLLGICTAKKRYLGKERGGESYTGGGQYTVVVLSEAQERASDSRETRGTSPRGIGPS